MTVRMTQYIYIRVYVGLFTNGRIYRPYTCMMLIAPVNWVQTVSLNLFTATTFTGSRFDSPSMDV